MRPSLVGHWAGGPCGWSRARDIIDACTLFLRPWTCRRDMGAMAQVSVGVRRAVLLWDLLWNSHS